MVFQRAAFAAMGIIAVLLFSQGYLGASFHVPLWVLISCQTEMALGTLFGGWRIVDTITARSSAWARPVRVSAVRRGLAGNIGIAWVVTLPATAIISAAVYFAASLV